MDLQHVSETASGTETDCMVNGWPHSPQCMQPKHEAAVIRFENIMLLKLPTYYSFQQFFLF